MFWLLTPLVDAAGSYSREQHTIHAAELHTRPCDFVFLLGHSYFPLMLSITLFSFFPYFLGFLAVLLVLSFLYCFFRREKRISRPFMSSSSRRGGPFSGGSTSSPARRAVRRPPRPGQTLLGPSRGLGGGGGLLSYFTPARQQVR